MTKAITDKEWADYLCEVLRQLDKISAQKSKDAPRLRKYVDEASEGLAGLIGYLVGAEGRCDGKSPLLQADLKIRRLAILDRKKGIDRDGE